MSDALFQNISTVQSNLQPGPTTVASTTVIAPQSYITLVSGTIDIATITPPVTGQHHLVLIPTDASPGDLLTTGNVLIGTTTMATNVPVLLYYNNVNAKYYVR